MKILLVNKFHYYRGGAEKYYLDMGKALESAGHQVAYFSMKHPQNIPCTYDKYFVSNIEFERAGLKDKLLAPGRVIYSREVKRKFARLLDDFCPDLIHLHNIYHQLSPSILPEAKKRSIPVVMHLHDYKLICPNYQLFVDNQPCTRCLDGNYWHCLEHRCFKKSVSQSLLASVEMTLHHHCWKVYEKNVSLYLAPSKFMKDICLKAGVPEGQIKLLYNFTEPITQPSNIIKTKLPLYLLYGGRLSPEKGIDLLLCAYAQAEVDYDLMIAGGGPQVKSLKALAKSLGLGKRVKFLGNLDKEQYRHVLDQALALAVPSLWYENMPFSLLEAMQSGKPVLAARTGGLPELIKEGKTGLLFERGDQKSLVSALEKLTTADIEALGNNAKSAVEDLSLSKHCRALIDLYQELISALKKKKNR